MKRIIPIYIYHKNKMELIFNWNNNHEKNYYATIRDVIKDWEQSYSYLGECEYECEKQAMINGMYNLFNQEWNDGKKRGKDFLEENEIDYNLIKAIEDVYICYKKECGYDVDNDLLEDKLDFIFLQHAEKELKNVITEHKLDIEYWGY
mgnify:FL=1